MEELTREERIQQEIETLDEETKQTIRDMWSGGGESAATIADATAVHPVIIQYMLIGEGLMKPARTEGIRVEEFVYIPNNKEHKLV